MTEGHLGLLEHLDSKVKASLAPQDCRGLLAYQERPDQMASVYLDRRETEACLDLLDLQGHQELL